VTGWWVAAALAQEAPVPEGAPVTFDTLVVATVQPATAADAASAERLEAALVARFSRSNTVVPMADVPYFDAQGYDGRTYMLGCPPNRYGGCALVIGQRAEVQRVVGASVRREPDASDPMRTLVIASFHVVDVEDGREVVTVAVPVPEGGEEAVVDGLAVLYDDVVAGDYALADFRDADPAEQARIDAERRVRMAEALDRLEAQLGVAVRSGDEGTLLPPRMTRADVREYADRDDTPPWEPLRMSPGEYLRFVNSGETVRDWVESGWGRTTRILVRVGVAGGPGPWSQRYVGQELLSGSDLSSLGSAQRLEVTRSGGIGADLELGFGVAPFLEVAGAAMVRTGESSVQYDQDVEGQPPISNQPRVSSTSTWQYGVRATFGPFPRWPARPTATAGLAFWSGHGTQAPGFERLPPPTRTFLELAPGVEVSASPVVAPFARLLVSVPVGGTPIRAESGQGVVPDPAPGDPPGAGYTVSAGLQLRFGPLVAPKVPR
jgi:hypothetical protein